MNNGLSRIHFNCIGELWRERKEYWQANGSPATNIPTEFKEIRNCAKTGVQYYRDTRDGNINMSWEAKYAIFNAFAGSANPSWQALQHIGYLQGTFKDFGNFSMAVVSASSENDAGVSITCNITGEHLGIVPFGNNVDASILVDLLKDHLLENNVTLDASIKDALEEFIANLPDWVKELPSTLAVGNAMKAQHLFTMNR